MINTSLIKFASYFLFCIIVVLWCMYVPIRNYFVIYLFKIKKKNFQNESNKLPRNVLIFREGLICFEESVAPKWVIRTL